MVFKGIAEHKEAAVLECLDNLLEDHLAFSAISQMLAWVKFRFEEEFEDIPERPIKWALKGIRKARPP